MAYTSSIFVLNNNTTFVVDNSAVTWTQDQFQNIGSAAMAKTGFTEAGKFHLNTFIFNGSVTTDANNTAIDSSGEESTFIFNGTSNIKGGGTGVRIAGADTTVTNLGTVGAATSMGVAFEFAGKDVEFTNNGTLTGKVRYNPNLMNGNVNILNDNDGKIADGIVSFGVAGSTVKITNEGQISGQASAYSGSDGVDIFVNHGTVGNWIFLGSGDDTFDNRGGLVTTGEIRGQLGNDTYLVDNINNVNVAELQGEGTDTVGSMTTIDLSTDAGGEIENIVLIGVGNLNATGNALANKITGNAGSNILKGLAGADILIGGAGNDTYYLDDADTVTEGVNAGTDIVRSTLTTYTLTTNVERLYLVGATNQDGKGNPSGNIIVGNGMVNKLEGLAGNDTIQGGAGNDQIYGGDGNDKLYGEAGNDSLSGGNGNDTLYGGDGMDSMTGGAGNDVFIFQTTTQTGSTNGTADTIYDFTTGDRISLSTIDASTKASGNQAFSFIGTAGFHGVAGELRYVKGASDTYIYADVNGDKKVDFAIHLDDAVTMQSSHFVL